MTKSGLPTGARRVVRHLNTIPVNANDLDPEVIQLGRLVGLLEGDDTSLEFIPDWFEDPLTQLETIPTQRAPELVKLLQMLIGGDAGHVLGTAIQEANRLWSPISFPEDGTLKPSGLYLVMPSNQGTSAAETIIGLGTLHQFQAGTDLTITPYVYFPLLCLPAENGSNPFIPGNPTYAKTYPVEIGIEVTGPKGKGLFSAGGVSFDGLKVDSKVFLADQPPTPPEIVLLNLQLPGEKPRDMSLSDLEKVTVSEWIRTAISLLTSSLKDAPQIDNMVLDALALLGITGDVPAVDWEKLVHAKDGPTAEAVFLDWFQSIAATPATLKTWLNDWYCLFRQIQPTPGESHITGSGSPTDPFVLPLLDEVGKFTLSVTVGTRLDPATKNLQVIPGIRLATEQIGPVKDAPQLQANLQCSIALVEFTLPGPGQAAVPVIPVPSIDLMAVVSNPTDALGADSQTFSIGSIQAGLHVTDQHRTPVPNFSLSKVHTSVGDWDSIDLTNFDELKRDFEGALGQAVQAGIEKLFGIENGKTANPVGQALAISLGLIYPPGKTTANWPTTLFGSADNVEKFITNPLGAISSFYLACLHPTTGTATDVWTTLLPNVAIVLGDLKNAGTDFSGAGTSANPWQTLLYQPDGEKEVGVYLQAWQPDPAQSALRFALNVGASFSIANEFAVRPQLVVEVLQLNLPDASEAFGANWLPSVSAGVLLSGTRTAGAYGSLKHSFGGVDLSIDDILIAAGWNHEHQFNAAVDIINLQVTSAGQSIPPIADLHFNLADPSSWEDNFLNQVAPFVLNAMGLWLLQHGGRLGVASTAVLGLLPSVPTFLGPNPPVDSKFSLPKIADFPTTWPYLKPADVAQFFSNPWTPLRGQLTALLSKSDYAEPLMQLLAWTITGTVPVAPTPQPAGNRANPWSVAFPNVWDLELLAWTVGGATPTALGFGLQRRMSSDAGTKVQIDTDVRLDLVQINLSGGGADAGLPRGAISCRLSNPTSNPLVGPSTSGLQVGSALFGAYFDTTGVTAVAELDNTRFASASPLATIDLLHPDLERLERDAADALLKVVMDEVSKEAAQLPRLAAMLNLLVDLQLLNPPQAAGQQDSPQSFLNYGANIGSWNSLLSTPAAFLGRQMSAVLADAAKTGDFFHQLAALIGFQSFDLPDKLAGLPYLLEAIDLMQVTSAGFTITLSNWIALVKNPVSYFEQYGKQLLSSVDARKQLATDLQHVSAGDVNSPFRVLGGSQIILQIPPNKPIQIGSDAQAIDFGGSLTVDLQSLSITMDVPVYSNLVQIAAIFQVEYSYSRDTVSWGIYLGAPPGALPGVFAPVEIAPTPNVKQLAEQLPQFVVSTLATELLNKVAIPKYPFIGNVATLLGLTPTIGDSVGQIQTLLGLFRDPIGWVLSSNVLGKTVNGQQQLDLAKLGTKLSQLPGGNPLTGPDGIQLASITDGIALSWANYGTTVSISATDTPASSAGVTINASVRPPIPGGHLQVAIEPGLTFGGGAGVSVHGDIAVTMNLGTDQTSDNMQLTVQAGYNKDSFTLDVTGNYDSTKFGPFEVIPFPGVAAFFNAQTAEAILLTVVKLLQSEFETYKGKNPTSGLVTFVDDAVAVANVLGIQTISGASTDPQSLLGTATAIEQDPLKWLSQFLQAATLKNVIAKLEPFLSTNLGIQGISQVGNRIQYQKATNTAPAATVNILFGLNDQNVFGVWIDPQVQADFLSIQAEAGIGMQTPLGADADLIFDLSTTLATDLSKYQVAQLNGGPGLSFDFEFDTKGTLKTYTLVVSPVGNAPSGKTVPAITLLPTPGLVTEDDTGKLTNVATGQWFLDFSLKFLVPMIADIAMRQKSVASWLDTPVLSSNKNTPGTVLKTWGLLAGGSPYTLAGIDPPFSDVTAPDRTKKIIEKLVASALSLFANAQIIKIGTDGGIWVEADTPAGKGYTDYGLRVVATDITLGSKSKSTSGSQNGSNGSKAPQRQVVLQLGKGLSGDDITWIKDSGGPSVDAGVVILLLRETGTVPSFHPRLQLNSVGIDIESADNLPLIDIKGYKIQQIRPRVFLDLQIENGFSAQYGAAIYCDELGLPMGPGFSQKSGTNTNPVAQSLVASKSGDSSAATTAVNPSFSFSVAMVSGGTFKPQLYDAQGKPTDRVWIPVQRAFGPLDCRKIGVGYTSQGNVNRLLAMFDGDVSLAGLNIDLDQLSVGIPINHPATFEDYTLDLAGMEVTFQGGPVEISGGFLKSQGAGYIAYTGEALIKAATFSIVALGSYADVQGHPSMFIFGALQTPLGDPTGTGAFFVTGLAAGFGYNRSLKLPAQDMVASFPLVAGVMDPSLFAGKTPDNVLVQLNNYIAPNLGVDWLAAGIKFTSWEIINSFALLSVEFGKEFEIGLLGLSQISLPVPGKGGAAYVYAEMALAVIINPEKGVFSATAVLTDNSYVIDKACRLTGGFAFVIWFKDGVVVDGQAPKAGEFVLTLGGYNPAYTPPKYFPQEPRLGFNWPVSSEISIKGGAYFALTPSCVMAGGALDASYESGDLKAWFDAYANFLISWKPFHYDISVGVSIGVSYTIHFIVTKTISISIGASLHIWGPEFRGRAEIHLWIVSVTISFGSGPDNPDTAATITWDQFEDSFLPKATTDNAGLTMAMAMEAPVAPSTPVFNPNICRMTASKGILGKGTDATGWIIRADQFVFQTETPIPATEISFVSANPCPSITTETQLGIQPLGSLTMSSNHQLTISGSNTLDLNGWTFTAVDRAVPASLWATVNEGQQQPGSKTIAGALVGIGSASPNSHPLTGPGQISIADAFVDEPLHCQQPLPLNNNPPVVVPSPPPVDDPVIVIQDTVMDDQVKSLRDSIIGAAVSFGYNVSNGSLSLMASLGEKTFQAAPMLGPLGSTGTPAKNSVAVVDFAPQERLAMAPVEAKAIPSLAMRAVVHQYTLPHSTAGYRLTGTTHSLDRFAHRQDVQRASGLLMSTESADAATPQVTVAPGTSILWDVVGGANLTFDGQVPIRVTTFDVHQRMVQDEMLHSADSKVTVSDAEVQLVVTGLQPGATATGSAGCGWNSRSGFVQVNSNALLGDGVVVRAQAPLRVHHGTRSRGHGWITGGEIEAQNIVETGPDQRHRGWTQTLLSGPIRTIAVTVIPNTLGTAFSEQAVADAISVLVHPQSAITRSRSTEHWEKVLTPLKISIENGIATLYYATPAPMPNAAGKLGVYVTTGEDFILEGVAGWVDEPASTFGVGSLRPMQATRNVDHELFASVRVHSLAGS